MPPTQIPLSLRSLGMTFRLGCRGQPVVMSFRISRPPRSLSRYARSGRHSVRAAEASPSSCRFGFPPTHLNHGGTEDTEKSQGEIMTSLHDDLRMDL